MEQPVNPTDAQIEAFGEAWNAALVGSPGARRRAGLKAVLDPIEKQIKDEMDLVDAQIEKHTFVFYGHTEPGSVDPDLAAKYDGLRRALAIVRGE